MVAKRPRIISLDLIRGYFIIAIIADHVSWRPNYLYFITGGGKLMASAAEGFFIISGILVGYLYGHKILENTKLVVKKLWKRALKFYLISVLFTAIFHSIAINLPSHRRPPITFWGGSTKDLIINTLTLKFSYGWTDFLPRYAIFMFLAPIILWLVALNRNKVALLISGCAWLLLRNNETLSPFPAWQILFAIGILLGHNLPIIENKFLNINKEAKKYLRHIVYALALVTYFINQLMFIVPVIFKINLINISPEILKYFDKNNMGPGRILLALLWFAAIYIFVRKNEQIIINKTKSVLINFGQNSLFVYCFHAFVLFAITATIYPINNHGVTLGTLYTIITIIFIYLGVVLKDRLSLKFLKN